MQVKELDATQLRNLVFRFEKAVNKNVEMRVKYPDQPEKFMDSEIALDEALASLHALSSVPGLYNSFVSLNAVQSVMSLMAHENTDIPIGVVSFFNEVVDAEVIQEYEDEDEEDDDIDADDDSRKRKGPVGLVMALIECNGISTLVNNLKRMDEIQSEEDAKCVFNTLSIFENIAEVYPEAVLTIMRDSSLLSFLFARMKKEGQDANKLYASEILSIYLQAGGSEMRKVVGKGNGVKKMIKLIAKYRRINPSTNEEIEYVENLFHSLCLSLKDDADNKARFNKAEGISLMITMIRKKMYVADSALKTIDFALQDSAPNCTKFVNVSGLKTLFAVFVGRVKTKKKKQKHGELNAVEEHVVSILVQLFSALSDVQYLRVLRKFQENDFEKIERLVELHEKYLDKSEIAERSWLKLNGKSKHANQNSNSNSNSNGNENGKGKEKESEGENGLTEDDKDMLYFHKIDNGLCTLQLIDIIIAFVSTSGEPTIQNRLVQLLNQRDSSIDDIKDVLQEFANMITDIEPEPQQKKKNVVRNLVTML